MAEFLLEVRDVGKAFGGVVTAEHVNMTVEAGQIGRASCRERV